MRFKQLVLADVPGQDVIRGQVAAVESEEEIAQPGVWRLRERIQHGVQEQLTKVVDGVGYESCDAEIVSS